MLASVVAWVAIRFRDRVAAAWAAAVGSLAVLHFVLVEYPLGAMARMRPEGWPFFSPEAIVAVVMAVALLTTGVVAWRSFKARPTTAAGPWRWTAEVALAAGALGEIAVFAYAAWFELPADLRSSPGRSSRLPRSGSPRFLARPARVAGRGHSGRHLIAVSAVMALIDVAPLGRLQVDPLPGRRGGAAPQPGVARLAALAGAFVTAGWVVLRWSPPLPFGAENRHGPSARLLLRVPSLCTSGRSLSSTCSRHGSRWASTCRDRDPGAGCAEHRVGPRRRGCVRGGSRARDRTRARFGLALLAVATGKVFLFDLARSTWLTACCRL